MSTKWQGYLLGAVCFPFAGPVLATDVEKSKTVDPDYIDPYYEGVWGCEDEFVCPEYIYYPSASVTEAWQNSLEKLVCDDWSYKTNCHVLSLKEEVERSARKPTYSKMLTAVTYSYQRRGEDTTLTDTEYLGLAWPSAMCPPGYALEDSDYGSIWPNASTRLIGHYTACRRLPGANSGRELGASASPASADMCVAGDSTFVGNPINTASFNKVERVVDLETPGLSWVRTYNSGSSPATKLGIDTMQKPRLARLGAGWRGSFDRSIGSGKAYDASTATLIEVVNLLREDGSFREFRPGGATYVGDADEIGHLTFHSDIWSYAPGDGSLEHYDKDGKLTELVDRNGRTTRLTYTASGDEQVLTEVRDDQGRSLGFTYDAAGRIDSVTAADGRRIGYEYSDAGASAREANLVKVHRADGSHLEYLYAVGTGKTHLLTGIIGADGRRFATYAYENGRAQATAHAGSTALATSVRMNLGAVEVTGRDGDHMNVTFDHVAGRIVLTRFEYHGWSPSEERVSTRTYNEDGTVSKLVDHDGSITTFTYDPTSKLETSRTEAVGMPEERTIRTNWNTHWRRPTRIDEPTRWTSFIYDDHGNPLEIATGGATDASDPASPVWPDVRRSRMTYDARGSLLSVDGPRTDADDITLYTYFDTDAPACTSDLSHCDWRKGDLASMSSPTGALWKATRYDGAGRLLAWTDANGLGGRVVYDALARVQERAMATMAGSASIEALDRREYDKADNLAATVDADGVRTNLRYDEAHRLIGVDLASGSHIDYTLDARDHRTAITVSDREGNPVYMSKTIYSRLGWPTRLVDAYGKETRLAHDKKGRLTSHRDPLGRTTTYTYDSLGRMTQRAVDPTGVAATSTFVYDSLDLLRTVDDPKRLRTTYLRNGLGNLLWQRSPDTGESTFGNDTAGSLAMITTAEGRVARHTYDAENRIVQTTFDEGTPQRYSYDTAPAICDATERFPVGRLGRVDDASGASEYCYDGAGRVTRKVQSTASGPLSVRYSHSLAGRLTRMTYPDGTVVTYSRDRAGQVATVALDHPVLGKQSLLDSVTWSPLQVPASWTFGSSRTLARTYDLNGRVTGVTDSKAGGLAVNYGYDVAGQIIQMTSAGTTVDWTYDTLGRLTEAKVGRDVRQTYTYDATGNRLSFADIAGSLSYTYPADSHHLTRAGSSARGNDRDGNTTTLDDKAFTYDASGRMATVSLGGQLAMTYHYNAWGEQVIRQHKGVATVTLYDEAGHWIGDYAADGKAIRQAIWLDDFPIAVIENGKLYDIETDHLGTPRAVVDRASDTVVWTWDSAGEAFGADAPDEDPDGDGKPFVFDMRFPGQRFDPVTGLNYNYRRDYEAATGRYVQSDPIGLTGGPSTYAYTSSTPLSRTDRFGLDDGYCRINPSWCGWAVPKSSVINGAFGVNETGVAAVLGQQAETGVAVDSTPNICVYSKLCGMAATGIGSGGSAGLALGVGTGALSSGEAHTASFSAQTGAGLLSGAAVDVDVSTGQIALSRGFFGAGGGAYAGMFVCRTVMQCVREPATSQQNGCD
jgi:RHS repeat-associated protein